MVDAPDLNDLVDQAIALKGLIHTQPLLTVLDSVNDETLIWDASADDLRRAKVQSLPNGVTSVGLTVAPTSVFSTPGSSPITTTGTFAVALKQQGGNKVLVAPLDGSTGDVGFRDLAPADITPPTVAMAALQVDWSVGNVFYKTLPVGATLNVFSFANVGDGQTIKVRIKQNAGGDGRVHWNSGTLTLTWTEGSEPTFTTAPNAYDIYVFTAVKSGGVIQLHGYSETPGGVTTVSATATPSDIFNIAVANPSSAPAIALSLDTQAVHTVLAGPASGADAIPTFRALTAAEIALSLGAQAANTVLAGPVTGANATPGFRVIARDDLILYSQVPAHIIDCSQGNVFRRILAGTLSTDTLHLNNGALGQRITVYLIQGASPGTTSVAWTTDDASGVIRWPNVVGPHTMTTGLLGSTDIVNFLCMGSGLYYGTYDKNFVP